MDNALLLSDRQKKFCVEYIVDFNATHAAIRAGYKPRSAGTAGSRLLQYPAIEAYIVQLRAEQRRLNAELAEQVRQELKIVAFADAGEHLKLAGENLMLGITDATKSRAIASVHVSEKKTSEGTSQQLQLKMHDKVGALKILVKLLGMYEEKPKSPDEYVIKTYRPAPTMYQITQTEKNTPGGLPQETEDGVVS